MRKAVHSFQLPTSRVSFLGEFGGLGHPVQGHLWKEPKDGKGNWGYGGIEDTKTLEGLEKTYLGLMDRVVDLAAKGLGGSVYTQTTDVEIEINGLMTYDREVTSLAGRRFEDGRVKVIAPDGATLFDYKGEVDCESFGLSGAAVYNAQRFIEHYHRLEHSNNPNTRTILTIEVWFGHNRLQYRGLKPRPVKEAIVTIGGVATDEIDPRTMESKLVPHLYFAGEVMDIDGPTGGYNLTMAFATARMAVASVGDSLT